MIRIQLAHQFVKRADIFQRRDAAGHALFRTPTQQARMMPEGLDAPAHLRPFRLLDGLAGQFHHHSHAVGPGAVEQLPEPRIVRIDVKFSVTGNHAVTVRGSKTGLAEFLKTRGAIKPDGEVGFSVHPQVAIPADGHPRGGGLNRAHC